MGDLKAVFDAPFARAIFAVASESQDIYAKMAENQQAFMDIMKNELLPIVYRRLNADSQEQ